MPHGWAEMPSTLVSHGLFANSLQEAAIEQPKGEQKLAWVI
jgi:hypothetical protein